MESINLKFITSEGVDLDNYPINKVDHDITLIDVPEHVILRCAKQYLTIVMQNHFRRGRGESGQVRVFGETLYYK